MKTKYRNYRLISLVTFLVTFLINGLANILPINGVTTGQVSDTFNVLFVPAAYVFSIWGLIYFLLSAFLAYQFFGKEVDQELMVDIAPRFWIANAANAVWLVLFHYELHAITPIAMVTLLVSLLGIYLKIQEKDLKKNEMLLVKTPFSVYLGWISVATIANITQFLYFLGWGRFGLNPEIWFILILSVAVIISVLMSKKFKDLAYSLVLIWAFVGIGLKFISTPIIAYSSFIAAGLVGAFYLIFSMGKKERSR